MNFDYWQSRRVMRVGVAIEETWDFFKEIYADLENHYETNLFERRETRLPVLRTRVNRYLFRRDLQRFMNNHDIVFFEWASQLLAAATKLNKTCGVVTRLHRYEMYQWVEQINWDKVDRVILVSEAMQDEFVSQFPEQRHKTVVCNASVSLERFSPEPRQFGGDLGILCHLTPRKRVYDLILAFYEMQKSRTDFRLHIAGGRHPTFEDYYRSLQHLVSELGLQEKVIFYGHVSDTVSWYKKIDIFISNSYSEGLQVAPMEAMASGCYCLIHRWAGADEMVPESNLFYTNLELSRKVIEYCDASDAERQQARQQMRMIARERFDIERTKAQIRAVITDVGRLVGSAEDR